jgi:hypothetical protein
MADKAMLAIRLASTIPYATAFSKTIFIRVARPLCQD